MCKIAAAEGFCHSMVLVSGIQRMWSPMIQQLFVHKDVYRFAVRRLCADVWVAHASELFCHVSGAHACAEHGWLCNLFVRACILNGSRVCCLVRRLACLVCTARVVLFWRRRRGHDVSCHVATDMNSVSVHHSRNFVLVCFAQCLVWFAVAML